VIREKSEGHGKPVIDLTGPDGNAHVLMGLATGWARQLGVDSKPIIADMMSGDYEHLLSVIEKHFGDMVILER
jgi:hypothetical protein